MFFYDFLISVNNVILFHNCVVQFILPSTFVYYQPIYGILLIPDKNEKSSLFNYCNDFALKQNDGHCAGFYQKYTGSSL